MAYLAHPSETKRIIEHFGFSFKKKFGQNFLIDENIVRKIVHEAGVTGEDGVMEIGPGIGTMTQVLCEEAKRVMAVEIDNKLIDVLNFTLEDYDNVTIINQDILKCDLASLVKEYNNGEPFKLVANLPYYITTPIIMGLLEANAKAGGGLLSSITVMIQKEVAERLSASPGTKDYGALTLAIQYYTDAKMLMTVPATCFMPRPNIDSAVIGLQIYKEPPVRARDERKLFSLIKAAFSQRRKTFINSVGSVTSYDKDKLREGLALIGKDENVRGEVLTLQEFITLSDHLN
ncbi:MAG: 16S rRNA (adenine(1518)-N(6)/adenine(1519)-N(6))-dimethyltransferase RsmA [Clostridiales bacterium]|nr:16S rRNA (adenine(1518)-N(6)/adenine(1519)-N(6))-dimethyltransferase RsmA [Clostridiales bacterium]MBS5877422.1 16S rRNA (adenine(1518)-N(6)/adenine(1519)-N(6))-dimethyltransferase RsmA [Clostridiales bacterium]MDU3490836.1 16S rRNA (adenine(1518)-N(6)/adenine(1519)-N(6))-dimethyltransferase RsmA [Clostridiales bacterium]